MPGIDELGVQRELRQTLSKAKHLRRLVAEQFEARAIADVVFVIFAMRPGAIDEVQTAAIIDTAFATLFIGGTIFADASFLHTFLTAILMIGALFADAIRAVRIHAHGGSVGHLLIHGRGEVADAQGALPRGGHVDMPDSG